MTRLLTRLFLPSISILLLSLTACGKKDTVINGRITDAKTGVSIGGGKIIYSLVDESYTSGSNHSIKSDPSGMFTIVMANDMHVYSFQIIQEGYLRKYKFDADYVKGDVNDVEIKLHPKDATLRLIYENSSVQEKPIYLWARSNTITEAHESQRLIVTQPYPLITQPNMKDTLDYPFISDEWIRLYWDFVPHSQTSEAQFQDSIYLIRGDTTTYVMPF